MHRVSQGWTLLLAVVLVAACAPTASSTPAAPSASPAGRADPGVIERIGIVACLLDPNGGFALEDLQALDPDLVLWLGDNVYGDRMAVLGDMQGLRGLYQLLGRNKRFRALAGQAAMMATWDDHDFGRNDAGTEWVFKRAARREFLRFWGAGTADPRSQQPGVYSARTFGSGDRTLQVILLDNRYNRDPYGDDPELTILGEEQWAWLRERLQEPATIRIIGSGIQVVNDYNPTTGEQWESWGDMPRERERLYALVRDLDVPRVFIVSGDMHHAELSRLDEPSSGFGYPTYDLTGSGLDQQEVEEWPNDNRIGTVLNTDRKFGFIVIDWSTGSVRLQLHDAADGTVHLDHTVALADLQLDG